MTAAPNGTVVYVVTKAGRIHRGYLLNDRVATLESCNLDQAAGREVHTELPEFADEANMCDVCLGEDRES